MINIHRTEVQGVTVLRLEGEIDEEGVDTLRVGLLSCLKEKRTNVIVNLSGIRYISYMGIGVLMERRRQLRRLGGDMKLVGLNLFVQRAFHMASVTALFCICDSEAQAVEGFREAA